MIILGIDPGSIRTGFGVIDITDGQIRYMDSGCIRITAPDLPQKLAQIYAGVSELIARHRPAELAIEQVFMSKNADSALKLGQARGAAIVCGANHGLEVAEYAARHIKQTVAGHGNADKHQVQQMVTLTLGIDGPLQSDASDALAIALTHHYACRGVSGRSHSQKRRSSGRKSWRQFSV
ncbi:crossover junction endodeoxyribonuclease RuvC [Larsenimonas suaedae]|uniref:Crossover junction endodeoxyribonuclease RuvC n=1 Tax=Larsenimonas suaedae TaxID=1851019 RepID=A0ABU1GX47_9GAMM|nr:crossover junction endodeoxyribonuclease RuvC [Larsenimonas suaedae]MCM2971369.1 crossover junction endodeoxyribonuclease RuvC [Larsenimonas suaedae]MDR5896625.1 crossover junction endodeoxyribonuclease RuvC [Larsenimonas suaedae]